MPYGHAYAAFLKKKNLRVTSQRDLILDVFLSTKHHVSAEELLGLVVKEQSESKGSTSSIGIATIYRTLKLFVEAEIATEGERARATEPNGVLPRY